MSCWVSFRWGFHINVGLRGDKDKRDSPFRRDSAKEDLDTSEEAEKRLLPFTHEEGGGGEILKQRTFTWVDNFGIPGPSTQIGNTKVSYGREAAHNRGDIQRVPATR